MNAKRTLKDDAKQLGVWLLAIWAAIMTVMFLTTTLDDSAFDPYAVESSQPNELTVEPDSGGVSIIIEGHYGDEPTMTEICTLVRKAYEADQAGAGDEAVRDQLGKAQDRAALLDNPVSDVVDSLVTAWDEFDIAAIDSAAVELGEICGGPSTPA
jgi:hypothetical protein